jgi:hypothetical protein
MGTTLFGLFPFIYGKFLHFRSQATVMWPAALAQSSCSHIHTLLLQPMAYRFGFLQRHLTAVHSTFLSVCLPGRSIRQTPASGLSFDQPSNRVDLPVFTL